MAGPTINLPVSGLIVTEAGFNTAIQGLSDDLADLIDGEGTARAAADAALSTALDAEETARAAADTALADDIDAEATTRAAADTTLTTALGAEATTRAADDAAEQSARIAADAALADDIDAEATARAAADTTEATARAAGDATEAAARVAGDAAEATARAAAITSAVAAEAVLREAADDGLDERATDLEALISTTDADTIAGYVIEDVDQNAGFQLSRDFLSMRFGGGTMAGDTLGGATTISTWDGESSAVLDGDGLSSDVIVGNLRLAVGNDLTVDYDDIEGIGAAFCDPDGNFYNHMLPDGTWANPTSVGGAPILGPPNLNVLHGGALYLLPDLPQTFFPAMLFPIRADAARVLVEVASGDFVASAHEPFTIDPALLGTSGVLAFARSDTTTTARTRIVLDVNVATIAASSPKVLMIGDSITNRQIPRFINERLTALSITVDWIGTVASSASGSDNADATGPLAEAREGRAYGDLVYSVLDGEATPLPVGDEATYLALSKADKLAFNPFLREEVGSEPDIARNGYVFDLRFYLDRFGFDDPDIMICALGENDAGERPTEAAADVLDAATIVLAQARAAVPTMKIALTMSGNANAPLGDSRWAVKAGCIRSIIQAVREADDPLISVISAWTNVSPTEGWSVTGATTDPATGIQTSTISDVIHPVGTARVQFAAALAAYIACEA